MDNYIGKHLLVDCYGCQEEEISSADHIINTMKQAANDFGMTIVDTFFHESDDEITAAAYGEKAHICIHAYPKIGYAAVDIYSFDTDLAPARSMRVLREALHPDKIRATSVKRGNITPDMKPRTNSKSTTLHKFKNTGHHMSEAGKKIGNYLVHKNEKREMLGPE